MHLLCQYAPGCLLRVEVIVTKSYENVNKDKHTVMIPPLSAGAISGLWYVVLSDFWLTGCA
jgi:hypothetical protein